MGKSKSIKSRARHLRQQDHVSRKRAAATAIADSLELEAEPGEDEPEVNATQTAQLDPGGDDPVAVGQADPAEGEPTQKDYGMDGPMMWGGGATSFDELDAWRATQEMAEEVRDLTYDFRMLMDGILSNPMVEDKKAALASLAAQFSARVNAAPTDKGQPDPEVVDDFEAYDAAWQADEPEGLVARALHLVGLGKAQMSRAAINDLPDSAFAYIEPGGKKDAGGKTTPRSLRHYPIHDKAHVQNALARASQAMSKAGKTAQIAKAALPKIRAAAKKMGVGSAAEEGKALASAFTVFKDGESWRWFGLVSNKYRDRDTRRYPLGEIITEAAHKEFVSWLDAHPEQAPQLWTWHTPGTAREKRADWWDYTSEGFLCMSGPLTEAEAKQFEPEEALAMSHGLKVLAYDEGQGLIHQYRTFEVTELPAEWPANPWTSFGVLKKEAEMAFTPEKRAHLVKRLGEAKVAELEAEPAALGKALEILGAEWKDAPAGQPPAAEPPADKGAQTTGTPEVQVDEHVLKALYAALGGDELKQGIAGLVEKVGKVEALEAKVAEQDKLLQAQADALTQLKKTDDEKVADQIRPRVSPVTWGFQASKNDQTVVGDAEADKQLTEGMQDGWLAALGPIQ